jgi:hypothetical protein
MGTRPADKQELFVTFKEMKEGREIENRFRYLKEDLKQAKGKHAAMIKEVNAAKLNIDDAQRKLNNMGGLDTAMQASGSGEQIIDDEKWRAFQTLKDCKNEYKAKYQEQSAQKQVLAEIEAKIKGSKVELVNAFNTWYTVNYGADRDADAGKVLDDFLDVGEQFDTMEHDRLEAIHPEGAAAVPFFKARKEFRLHHGARRA